MSRAIVFECDWCGKETRDQTLRAYIYPSFLVTSSDHTRVWDFCSADCCVRWGQARPARPDRARHKST